jgi:hypothetical protein
MMILMIAMTMAIIQMMILIISQMTVQTTATTISQALQPVLETT